MSKTSKVTLADVVREYLEGADVLDMNISTREAPVAVSRQHEHGCSRHLAGGWCLPACESDPEFRKRMTAGAGKKRFATTHI